MRLIQKDIEYRKIQLNRYPTIDKCISSGVIYLLIYDTPAKTKFSKYKQIS
jgi:hypothetical protein